MPEDLDRLHELAVAFYAEDAFTTPRPNCAVTCMFS